MKSVNSLILQSKVWWNQYKDYLLTLSMMISHKAIYLNVRLAEKTWELNWHDLHNLKQ